MQHFRFEHELLMELNIEVVAVLVVRIEGNDFVVEVFVVLVGVGVVAVVVEYVQSENNILYFGLFSNIHVFSYVWLLWLLLLWLLIFIVFRNLLTIFIGCFVDKGWWSYGYTFAWRLESIFVCSILNNANLMVLFKVNQLSAFTNINKLWPKILIAQSKL